MENSTQNQNDTPAEPSEALLDVSLMFEQLPPETRKTLIELMRQFTAKS